MFDFRRKIYDDFVSGDLVFVATHEQVDQIGEMVISFGDVLHNLVLRGHPILNNVVIVGHRWNHEDWHGGDDISGDDLADIVAIQWDTTEELIRSLNEDSLDDIFDKVAREKAYVNINPMGEDVDEMIELLGTELEELGVCGGHDYDNDRECTPTEYIRYLYGDYYRNMFVEDGGLTASNDLGIGTDSSSIYPSMVYPISYLVKKDSVSDRTPLYTEEDFSEIFN